LSIQLYLHFSVLVIFVVGGYNVGEVSHVDLI